MKFWHLILGVVGATVVTEASIKLGCRVAERINRSRLRIKQANEEKQIEGK